MSAIANHVHFCEIKYYCQRITNSMKMAEKNKQMTSSVEILEDLLRCMVCFEQFTFPKVLHCQHTFCEECLRKWNGKGGGGSKGVSCPTCRVRTPLPENSISALPSDFKVTKLGELIKQVSVRNIGDNRLCDICTATGTSKSASHFCAQCSESLCLDCCEKHNNNSLFTNHHVVDLSVEASTGKLFCAKHNTKPIKYMCHECSLFICTVCALNTHNGHNVQDLDTGLKQHTDQLSGLLAKIKDKVAALKSVYDQLTEIQILLKGLHDDLEEKIDGHIDAKVEKIQACQYELQNLLTTKEFGPSFADVMWAINAMQQCGSQAIGQQATFLLNQIKDTKRTLHDELKVKHNEITKEVTDRVERTEFHLGSIESLASYLEKILTESNSLEVITIYEDLTARAESVLDTDLNSFTETPLALMTFDTEGGEHQIGQLSEEHLGMEEFLDRLRPREELPDSTEEEEIPPEDEEEIPPGDGEDMPPADEDDMPPADEDDMPPAYEDDMPPPYQENEELEGSTANIVDQLEDDIANQNTENDEALEVIDQLDRTLEHADENVIDAAEAGVRTSSATSTMSSTATTSSAILEDSRPLRGSPTHSIQEEPSGEDTTGLKISSSNSKDDLVPDMRPTPETSRGRPRSESDTKVVSIDPITGLTVSAEVQNIPSPKAQGRPKSSYEPILNPLVREISTDTSKSDHDERTRSAFNRSTSMPDNSFKDKALSTLYRLVWEKEGVSSKMTSMKKVSSSVAKKQRQASGGSPGSHSGLSPEIRFPTDVAFLPNGDVIVADSGDKNLQVLSMDTKMWSKVKDRKQPYVNTRPIAWSHIEPISVVIAPLYNQELMAAFPTFEGELVVITDEKDKCVKMIDIRHKGSCVATWGKSWFSPMFKHPSGLAITDDGKWVVTDIGKHNVSIHDSDGRCIHTFGSKGKGAYGFEMPKYVITDKHHRILVSDTGNGGIKVYDQAGQFLFKIGIKESTLLSCPAGICLDGDGNILVAERQRHTVLMFSPDGRFIQEVLPKDSVHSPSGIAVSPTGQLVVSQLDPATVKYFEIATQV